VRVPVVIRTPMGGRRGYGPTHSQTLEKLFAGRNINVEQMMASLRKVADDLGLPMGYRRMTYNSRLAQELGKWAESMGKGEPFHHAMFRAYFVDGLNIGKTQNLVKVAESIDLSGKDALDVIRSGAYKEAVDSDWNRSMELQVKAVPTFLYNRQVLVGAQPYEALKKLVMTDNIKRKEV